MRKNYISDRFNGDWQDALLRKFGLTETNPVSNQRDEAKENHLGTDDMDTDELDTNGSAFNRAENSFKRMAGEDSSQGSPTPPLEVTAAANSILYEAEQLSLNRYRIETVPNSGASGGKHISLKSGSSSGSASGVFTGEDGLYQVKLRYFDENDGKARATFTVAGQSRSLTFDKSLPSAWTTPASLTSQTTHASIRLKSGDRFSLSARGNKGELARIDAIEFIKLDAPPSGGSGGNPSPSPAPNNSFASQVLALTNQFRADNGLPPLRLNTDLTEAAQDHVQDMAQQDFFSHTGLDGSTPLERSREAGYSPTAIGENIAAGQRTPESVVNAWINSPGHRANLLNRNYTEIGIGYTFLQNDTGNVNYNHYWAQVFGRSNAPATAVSSAGSSPSESLMGAQPQQASGQLVSAAGGESGDSPSPSDALSPSLNGTPQQVGSDLQPLDSNQAPVQASHSANQTTVRLNGEARLQLEVDYPITPETRLSVEFRSDATGGIQAIGFDSNTQLDEADAQTHFQLGGDESWGIPTTPSAKPVDDITEAGWTRYEIPVGEFLTGEQPFLSLISDLAPGNEMASSEFRNLMLFEDTPGAGNAESKPVDSLLQNPAQSLHGHINPCQVMPQEAIAI